MVQGSEDFAEANIVKPLIHSDEETWAPSGIAFVNQGPWSGKLLVANLRGRQLLSISFNGNGKVVKSVESFFKNQYGRLREVIQDRDGSIYITTSNRDGRGNPDAADDKIIQLIPK
jgi:glucose/arabinose dehydrogenase